EQDCGRGRVMVGIAPSAIKGKNACHNCRLHRKVKSPIPSIDGTETLGRNQRRPAPVAIGPLAGWSQATDAGSSHSSICSAPFVLCLATRDRRTTRANALARM